MRCSETDILDAAAGCTGLAAVEGTAASLTQRLRVSDGEWLDAVFAEDCRCLIRHVVDTRIRSVAVVGESAAAKEVVGELVGVVGIRDAL